MNIFKYFINILQDLNNLERRQCDYVKKMALEQPSARHKMWKAT